MNPFSIFMRRPMVSLLLGVVVLCVGVAGLYCARVEIPGVNTHSLYAKIDYVRAHPGEVKTSVLNRVHSYFAKSSEGETKHEEQKIVVTTPEVKDVTLTQDYVCQIHGQQHINVCALESGYLQEILVNEGQLVKKGDPLFKILPTLYQAKFQAETAEAHLAELEYENSKQLKDRNVVSNRAVMLLEAKMAKAKAQASLAGAELNFTIVTAPFDGIVDRRFQMLGSFIKEGEVLTTLSDNSLMWVYFNVTEAQYLQYMADRESNKQDPVVDLILATGETFNHSGKISTIEAKFNNTTGTVPFRADFPNPDRLLRHGQTGKVRIRRRLDDALVIPQRATFDVLDKRYAYVVDKDDVVHQRELKIQHTLEDIFVLEKGIEPGERIVLEGVRQIHDKEKIEYEFRSPEVVLAHLKNRAE